MRQSVRFLLLSSAATAVLFATLLAGVYFTDQGRWLDNAALAGFVGIIDSPGYENLAHALVSLCDPVPFAVISLALIGVAVTRRAPHRAAAAGAVLFGSAVTTQLLKPTLAHDRFDGTVAGLDGITSPIASAAFPSGHGTAAMAIALAAVIVAPRALRPLTAAAGALFALTSGCMIAALGWHYPSDVVGGYLVATAWCLVTLAALHVAGDRWPARGTIRAAARSQVPALQHALLPVAAVTTALGAGVALGRLDRIAEFAVAHTSTTAAVIAIAATATALVTAVSLADHHAR